MRKLLGYALVRPAREVLFTVVSREEKYKAKLTIDAVVQRLGDTVAALMFEVLGEQPWSAVPRCAGATAPANTLLLHCLFVDVPTCAAQM